MTNPNHPTELVYRDINFRSRLANGTRTINLPWGATLFSDIDPNFPNTSVPNNQIYSNNLATTLMALSSAAYDANHIYSGLQSLGFRDVNLFHYPDHSNNRTGSLIDIGYSFSHRQMTINGEEMTIIAVVIRGSDNIQDWIRNFHLGVDMTYLTGGFTRPVMSPAEIHRGFNDAAVQIRDELRLYLERHGPSYSDRNKILITGHSLGAATTNLLAHELTISEEFVPASNIYAYGFATPNTEFLSLAKRTAYTNIFNVIIAEDPITRLPPSVLGWRRFGSTLTFPSESNLFRGRFNREFQTLIGLDRNRGREIMASNTRLLPLLPGVSFSKTPFFYHYPEIYLAWLKTTSPAFAPTVLERFASINSFEFSQKNKNKQA